MIKPWRLGNINLLFKLSIDCHKLLHDVPGVSCLSLFCMQEEASTTYTFAEEFTSQPDTDDEDSSIAEDWDRDQYLPVCVQQVNANLPVMSPSFSHSYVSTCAASCKMARTH